METLSLRQLTPVRRIESAGSEAVYASVLSGAPSISGTLMPTQLRSVEQGQHRRHVLIPRLSRP